MEQGGKFWTKQGTYRSPNMLTEAYNSYKKGVNVVIRGVMKNKSTCCQILNQKMVFRTPTLFAKRNVPFIKYSLLETLGQGQ